MKEARNNWSLQMSKLFLDRSVWFVSENFVLFPQTKNCRRKSAASWELSAWPFCWRAEDCCGLEPVWVVCWHFRCLDWKAFLKSRVDRMCLTTRTWGLSSSWRRSTAARRLCRYPLRPCPRHPRIASPTRLYAAPSLTRWTTGVQCTAAWTPAWPSSWKASRNPAVRTPGLCCRRQVRRTAIWKTGSLLRMNSA